MSQEPGRQTGEDRLLALSCGVGVEIVEVEVNVNDLSSRASYTCVRLCECVRLQIQSFRFDTHASIRHTRAHCKGSYESTLW